MQYLALAYNSIDSVENLTGLKYLTELRLHNNQLTDVRALRSLVNLEILYLGHNQIQDIGFFNTLTALELLYVNDNKISDVSSLTSLSKLEIINVSNNNISSLSVLRNYTDNLTEIYAENNKLTDNVEPESFETFFDAICWATISLTTVGYGDIYPVTTIGRIVTMISSVFGIAIIALPSGVITAGYLEEVNKENHQ